MRSRGKTTGAAAAASAAIGTETPTNNGQPESSAGPAGARRSLSRVTRSKAIAYSTASEDGSSPSTSVWNATELAVIIPRQSTTSGYTSLSSPSSREESIFDKGSNTGSVETPATASAHPTPAESDAASSSRRPIKRVSAATRALELRNTHNSLSFGGGVTGTRKRPNPVVDEDADAALARSLQEAEYAQELPNKKIKAFTNHTPKNLIEIEDSTDDVLSSVSDMDMSFDDPTERHQVKDLPSDFEDFDPDLSDFEDGFDANFNGALDDPLSNPWRLFYGSEDGDGDGDEDDMDDDLSGFLEAANRISRAARQLQPYRRLTRAQRERKKLEDSHPIVKTMWESLEAEAVLEPVPDPQPPAISRRLKPFQLEGVNWMRRQEQTHWKGGLLGDEMGMGKTIQAVSLLMSDYPVGKPSLVVVPPVALMQWSSEIESYTDGKLKVLVYHNSNSKVKQLKLRDLKAYDVIMISYSGLESMHRKEVKGWRRGAGMVKEDSLIHSIDFHRVILDEAHNIKQRTTSSARACFELKSTYKWCLSGTPVQNRIGEFFSLLRFLEVKPFACYFCKACSCQQLHWSQDKEKRCTHCKHSGFNHVSIFNQDILNPITEANSTSRSEALKKLRLLTDRIMLRRVKKDHTSSMELPPKRIEIHNEFFGEIERDFSSSIMTNSARQFDTYVSRGVMLNNYANIFGLIMQMRQVANHPDLILKKHGEGGQNVLVCSICDEPAEEAIRSRCRHEFCRQCVKDYVKSFESGGEPDCPRCHIGLSIDLEQPEIEQQEDEVKKNSIVNRIRMEDWTSSTKIEMLVYDLYKLRSNKQSHKSIVFSQFTSMLQLVEWRLRRAGISTVMLDGSMTPAQRQKSIEYFMNNVDVEVFLVSLKAGGVALNLTEASRVFIIDPWWNPAAEWQSADRCHRIGQRRPCVITRLCIEDSVESRMVLLQEKKANMINGTLNKDQSEALEKLTPEDMEFLFRGT